MAKQYNKAYKNINTLSDLIEKSKKTNSVYELNELLRKIIMGNFGDTKFDILDIKKQHNENSTWKKS